MKYLLVLLVIFTSSCQLTNQTPAPYKSQQQEVKIINNNQENNIFKSRNLLIPQFSRKKVKIALLLPLSGDKKDLGWNLANSSFISLFDNDDDDNIELVLFDSKGTAKGAKKAFKEIINKNIKLVIGPIFSSAVKAIEAEALRYEITVISFSNNTKLIGKINDYGGIFLAGMRPEAGIDRMISYALDNEKYNFAIIAPNSKYGHAVTSKFKQIVKGRDGNFITAQFYKSNERDLNRAVNRVITSFRIPQDFDFREDEHEVSEEDKIYPQVIMIPQSGNILAKIMQSIQEQNIDERQFQFIGSSQWDDITTLENKQLQGSWFAAPDHEEFADFEQKYYDLYKKFPPRISSLAYDIIMATSILVEEKDGKYVPNIRDFVNYQGKINGFIGIDGPFRFLPNGIVQRNLAVLEIDQDKLRTLAPANEEFLRYNDNE